MVRVVVNYFYVFIPLFKLRSLRKFACRLKLNRLSFFFFANKVTSNALTMVMSKGVGLFSAQVFLFEERSIHAFVLWANWVPSIVYSMESIVYFSYSFSDLQIFLDGHDKFWITFVDVAEKVCCLLPARR